MSAWLDRVHITDRYIHHVIEYYQKKPNNTLNKDDIINNEKERILSSYYTVMDELSYEYDNFELIYVEKDINPFMDSGHRAPDFDSIWAMKIIIKDYGFDTNNYSDQSRLIVAANVFGNWFTFGGLLDNENNVIESKNFNPSKISFDDVFEYCSSAKWPEMCNKIEKAISIQTSETLSDKAKDVFGGIDNI